MEVHDKIGKRNKTQRGKLKIEIFPHKVKRDTEC